MDDRAGMNPAEVPAARPELAPSNSLRPAPAQPNRLGDPGEDELFRDPFAEFHPSGR
jgi:hypothetical protein